LIALALLFVTLLAADPHLPQDLLKRGLLALQRGKIAEARADLEQASRADPKNAYVWTALAQTYLKANEPKLASSAAETAEKIAPQDPVVSHALAMYYSEIGQLQHAAKLDAQIAFQATKALLERGDFTQAADMAQSGLAGHSKDAQLVLALGVARYGQRRFDDAVVQFLRVIQIDPQIDQPYVFLGKMLDQAGSHLDEITRDYEAWTARDPQNAKAQLLLAKALIAANNRDPRAESLLRKSIALEGADWEAHYELGVLLEGKHDYPGAAKELERSIELDAKQPMPHYHLARMFDRLGQPERAQAEREAHERLTAGSQR
jgi:Flp pilus assembly protein TadD